MTMSFLNIFWQQTSAFCLLSYLVHSVVIFPETCRKFDICFILYSVLLFLDLLQRYSQHFHCAYVTESMLPVPAICDCLNAS